MRVEGNQSAENQIPPYSTENSSSKISIAILSPQRDRSQDLDNNQPYAVPPCSNCFPEPLPLTKILKSSQSPSLILQALMSGMSAVV
jgi:hypothetical protein